MGRFNQQIQVEMIKEGKGDIDKLEGLRQQAFEGAFGNRFFQGSW